MSKKEKKRETNYLVEYLQQVYMADQKIGLELFTLNQKALEALDEKKSS